MSSMGRSYAPGSRRIRGGFAGWRAYRTGQAGGQDRRDLPWQPGTPVHFKFYLDHTFRTACFIGLRILAISANGHRSGLLSPKSDARLGIFELSDRCESFDEGFPRKSLDHYMIGAGRARGSLEVNMLHPKEIVDRDDSSRHMRRASKHVFCIAIQTQGFGYQPITQDKRHVAAL